MTQRSPSSGGHHRWSSTVSAMGLSAVLLATLPASAAAATDQPTPAGPGTNAEATETHEPDDTATAEASEAAETPEPSSTATATEPDVDEAGEDTGVVDLQILSTNDFHGRLERDGSIAGVEIMACSVDALRQENPNTLFVGAGDHIGASTFTSWATDDEAAIEALNLMGLDVTSVGNHEFDRGWADLRDRVVPLSDFSWLAANAVDSSSGEPILDPYEIHQVGGIDVALIGLNTTDMPRLVSPGGIQGIEWRDLDTTANYWADYIAENEDVDLTLVMVHEGINGTSLDQASGQIADLIDNADERISAIITGHTHREYAEQTDAGVWVTQTGEYTRNLGQLNISYDTATGEIVDSQAQVLPLIGSDEEPVYCSAGDRPDLAELVDDAVATAEEVGNEVIGEADPGFARAQNESGAENRSARSTLADLIADSQAWAARQSANEVDFAVMNPGGVRADLPPGTEGAGGEITFRDLATIQPFGNLINSVRITGAEFKEALELQWRDGRDLMLGISEEVSYTYDPQEPIGDRVSEIWLDGEPMDLQASYLIAANSFLAEGGDGFTPFAAGNLGTTGQVDMDGFIAYTQQGQDGYLQIDPHLAKRSLAVTWESDADMVYGAGDEIALDIAGLAWNVPALADPENVEVSLGATDAQSVEVDTSWPDAQIAEDNDLRGSAEIRVEVPEHIEFDASGDSQAMGISAAANGTEALSDTTAEIPLVITEPSTGLELVLPVTVEGRLLVPGGETPGTDDPPTDDPTPGATPSGPSEPQATDPATDGTRPDIDGQDKPSDSPTTGDSATDDQQVTSSADERGGPLAQTGATVAAVAGIALALLILGMVLLWLRRHRDTVV